jgi:hypothetical protein
MTGALHLAWRLQRAQLLFCLGLCGGLAGVALWLAADMRSMLTGCGTPQAARACEFIYPFQQTHGGPVAMVQALTDWVPYGVGMLLGIPMVAREVEHRTALIAWPLAGSRLRWLAWRAVPVIFAGLALVTVLAAAVEQMDQAYLPKSDLGFLRYDGRGLPLVMRALVALLLGVGVGALVGRLLSGLLIGIGLSVALSVGLSLVLDRWVPSAEMSTEQSPESGGTSNPLTTELRYRLPDGSLVSAEEGEVLVEAAYEDSGGEEPDPDTLPQAVFYGISADRYGEVVVRESLALGVLAAALGGAAAVVVRRRRPE